MNILIPAAGKGSRFANSKYRLPKPNISVGGLPMVVKAAKSLRLEGNYIFILQETQFRNDLVKQIYESFPNCKIAVIDFYTDGAAETCLIAKDLINNTDELVIANCDQIMNWDADVVLKQLRKYDAGLVTINSDDPKHSYARLSGNLVEEVQEKNVISDYALTGIHYWKDGSDFVRTATKMLDNSMTSQNEFYVGPTYNYLIQEGKKVGIAHINHSNIDFIGTPEDLEKYESRKTV